MATSSQEVIDQFATQAMHAILSNQELTQAVTKMGSQAITYDEARRAIAGHAYDLAMAMFAERSKRLRADPEFTFKGEKKTLL